MSDIHTFDNGVKIYDHQLWPTQKERYSKNNIHEPEEEEALLQLIQLIPANACYMNLGSAVGYYPLLLKKIAPGLTIHLVEPLVLHEKYFAENVALNSFQLSDFIYHQEALSHSEVNATLLECGYTTKVLHENETGEKAYYKERTQWRQRDIKTITMDILVAQIGHDIDLLQMDVQGKEIEVFNGAQKSLHTGKIKLIMMGTHSESLHRQSITYLKDFGYSVVFEKCVPQYQPDGIVIACKDPDLTNKINFSA